MPRWRGHLLSLSEDGRDSSRLPRRESVAAEESWHGHPCQWQINPRSGGDLEDASRRHGQGCPCHACRMPGPRRGAASSPLAKMAVFQAVYLEERAWQQRNRGMGILAHGRLTPGRGVSRKMRYADTGKDARATSAGWPGHGCRMPVPRLQDARATPAGCLGHGQNGRATGAGCAIISGIERREDFRYLS